MLTPHVQRTIISIVSPSSGQLSRITYIKPCCTAVLLSPVQTSLTFPLSIGALAPQLIANPEKVLRDRRRAGRVAVREFGRFGTARRFSRRGARMRFVFLFGVLAALSGCAMHRDVTFIYYPNAPHRDTFPRPYEFYAQADKECEKYGMRAARTGAPTPLSIASGRLTIAFNDHGRQLGARPKL